MSLMGSFTGTTKPQSFQSFTTAFWSRRVKGLTLTTGRGIGLSLLAFQAGQDFGTFHMVDHVENAVLGAAIINVGILDIEPKAMQFKLSAFDQFGYPGIAFQVLQLQKDVMPRDLVDFLGPAQFFPAGADPLQGPVPMAEPLLEVGHLQLFPALAEGRHGPAIRK